MKINKKIHTKLINNLKEWRNEFVNQIDIDIQLMEDCPPQGVEHLMYLKSMMLKRMFSTLCLGSNQCYFCLKNNPDVVIGKCVKCEYGEFNKICTTKDSKFYELQNILDDLRNFFDMEYWRFKNED